MSRLIVTVLRSDRKWVPVEVEAQTMEEAVDAVIDLDWVDNVIECTEAEGLE